jgi:hypothetical protein
LDPIEHRIEVAKSYNGLRLYSDIHRCSEGVLEINNLHIDANYSIRSYEQVKLPSTQTTKRTSKRRPGIPSPRPDDKRLKKIRLTQLVPNTEGFRFILNDEVIRISIVIGEVDLGAEVAQSVIRSDLGGISLFYFHSAITFTNPVRNWLTFYVNALETVIPSKLGLIIESLWYIQDLSLKIPTKFDERLIKTMLASHEIFFQFDQSDNYLKLKENLESRYSAKDVNSLHNLVSVLVAEPDKPLLHYSNRLDHDFLYLIYLFLILEKENFISVLRPEIVNT